jgi:hypothetical protein
MDANGREWEDIRTADEPAVAKAMAGKPQMYADAERCLPAAAGRGAWSGLSGRSNWAIASMAKHVRGGDPYGLASEAALQGGDPFHLLAPMPCA